MSEPVMPTHKGRAYIEWRMQDRDHSEDDDAIVAFSAGWDACHLLAPTREQIAVALHRSDESASYDPFDYDRGADAVLALIHNGADRD